MISNWKFVDSIPGIIGAFTGIAAIIWHIIIWFNKRGRLMVEVIDIVISPNKNPKLKIAIVNKGELEIYPKSAKLYLRKKYEKYIENIFQFNFCIIYNSLPEKIYPNGGIGSFELEVGQYSHNKILELEADFFIEIETTTGRKFKSKDIKFQE